MRKRCFFALAFGLLLSFSGYAQSESKGSFFFSIGLSNGIFSSGPIVPFSNFEIKKLFALAASGNYEFPFGAGNAVFGLEAGYSSGSRFGGSGDVDFIPFGLTAAYVYPLTSFFYVGPRLKLGGLGLLGPDWGKVVFTPGARLEAELRSNSFPLGLFVAAGIDLFPFAPEFAMLPVLEAGIRFPRGKWQSSASAKTANNKEPAAALTGGSQGTSSGQASGAAAAGTGSVVTAGSGPVTAAAAGSTGAAQSQGTSAGAAAAVSGPATGAAQSQGTPAGAAAAVSGPVAGAAQGQNRIIILENGKQGTLNSIYFEPDTDDLIASYRPILDAVGRQLTADPGLRLLIRGYAANLGYAGGRYDVSYNRAKFSSDELTRQYGIPANRLSIEAFGDTKPPIDATEDPQSRRCVELILYRD
jgi:outer membrane protein OmpA-like peptidoglycan-associated protein